MSEQAKAMALRFFEHQDEFGGAIPDGTCAEGYIANLAGVPSMNLESHRQFSAAFYEAFPDLEHVVEEVIADGDRVVVRMRLRGTNSGAFMGNPPSGKPIDVGALALVKVADGKVTELRGEFDRLVLMEQIGALPAQ